MEIKLAMGSKSPTAQKYKAQLFQMFKEFDRHESRIFENVTGDPLFTGPSPVLDDRMKGFYFLALENEQVLGFIGVKVLTQELSIPTLYITDFFVRFKYQGKGVGRALMEKATEYGRSTNCKRVLLSVLSGNDNAEKFYRGDGFVPTKINMMKPL